MKRITRIYKKTDITQHRILIPKFIIDKYGREFYIDIMEDETIMLTPKIKEEEEEGENEK